MQSWTSDMHGVRNPSNVITVGNLKAFMQEHCQDATPEKQYDMEDKMDELIMDFENNKNPNVTAEDMNNMSIDEFVDYEHDTLDMIYRYISDVIDNCEPAMPSLEYAAKDEDGDDAFGIYAGMPWHFSKCTIKTENEFNVIMAKYIAELYGIAANSAESKIEDQELHYFG